MQMATKCSQEYLHVYQLKSILNQKLLQETPQAAQRAKGKKVVPTPADAKQKAKKRSENFGTGWHIQLKRVLTQIDWAVTHKQSKALPAFNQYTGPGPQNTLLTIEVGLQVQR